MIKRARISVFLEDSTSLDNENVWGQHGIGMHISVCSEAASFNIVFDTGTSPEVISHNLDVMELDFKTVSFLVLSHGHRDHTGGLIEVLRRIGKRVPVIAHPDAFFPKFAKEPYLREIGIPYNKNVIENAGGVITLIRNGFHLSKDCYFTGEIERSNDFERPVGFLTEKDGVLDEDLILDDSSIVLDTQGGLVIVTGCGHAGIINIMKSVSNKFNGKKIHTVIGGFHLARAEKSVIDRTVDELKKFQFEKIIPLHCTGIKATNAIINAFQERTKLLYTGSVETLEF